MASPMVSIPDDNGTPPPTKDDKNDNEDRHIVVKIVSLNATAIIISNSHSRNIKKGGIAHPLTP